MAAETEVKFYGRAYGRPQGQPDEALIQCGPGTLGGELLRRYWQPVALSAQATTTPRLVKILDEELILFRDGSGRPGLLYPRCVHRGTTLLFGKVETNGIRCCYHGYLFDAEGVCLETPCEPNKKISSTIRQPWYPVVEKYGLIFAFMGPPGKEPQLPLLSIEESLGDDEEIVALENVGGPNGVFHPKISAKGDYNWWQVFDNVMDPFHVVVTHFMINGVQFVPSLGILPEVKFEYTKDGVRSIQHRRLEDGKLHQRVTQVILPNIHCIPGVTDEDLTQSNLGWIVPRDDTSFSRFFLLRTKKGGELMANFQRIGMLQDDWGPEHGKPFLQWDLEDRQQWQTDYEAQKGQGDITLHSEEHLSGIDVGTVMMRRLFKKEAKAVAEGRDPVGVAFDKPYRIDVIAGNALLDPVSLACIAGFDGRKDQREEQLP